MKITVLHRKKEIHTLEHSGDYSRLKIQIPDHSGHLELQLAVPILDIHGFWIPESRTPSTRAAVPDNVISRIWHF